MARPTGRPPSRQPDVNEIPTSSETNIPSPGDSGINIVDCDLSLDSFLDSIGMQHTDAILDSNSLEDFQLFSQLPTGLRANSPTAKVSQQPRGDLGSSSQSATSPYQLNNTLFMPQAGPTDLGLSNCSPDRVETLLSQLHLELCNLLSCVRSAPWDVQDVLRLTISPESNASQDGGIGDSHPLIQVARISKELEKLLASLRPSTAAAVHTPQTITYDSGSPTLCTTQLLVALSCYIQIVSIYDSIFSTVFEYLATGGPAASLASLSTSQQPQQLSTPMLYLGGLPILPNRKLCGTLLVHQIEHQLERIEMFVGLPEHYRISSKSGDEGKDVVNGLFAGQHSQSLLHSVFQLGEFRPEDDTRSVRSLKLKMRQMKDL
ncbi:hypothetical protein N7456_011516 [Penicillium angulare]|uniref:Uncharacterized protein n=1 Tax=Penicillium angulare TaxID=116970 RepID=A0A9W9K058_9EURO|nr:hypothetical protein N7456_011516 [Penicillium angulare]